MAGIELTYGDARPQTLEKLRSLLRSRGPRDTVIPALCDEDGSTEAVRSIENLVERSVRREFLARADDVRRSRRRGPLLYSERDSWVGVDWSVGVDIGKSRRDLRKDEAYDGLAEEIERRLSEQWYR